MKRVRQCVECVEEEVRCVIFRKANSVDVHDRVEVGGAKTAKRVVSLNQQWVTRRFHATDDYLILPTRQTDLDPNMFKSALPC